ncbi:MAG: phosphate ABC transporter substrate-binding protein [Calditrichaceae bacterium]|nr:phosphate ABC transporter substrate-binding protein [Calditrichaceae bacterium]MBN2710039.1 phosphate ABC transporter substrate-binding protein [Calditrichaceae bacterium]RQV92139.1 MAG: phosphate ABC transporter substrate-binding protein [Calditrichota bacterium]
MNYIRTFRLSLLVIFIMVFAIHAQVVKVDEKIPPYKKQTGISGNANSIGSDTMNNLMTLWLEGFRKYYPLVNIQIEGKGSSTAPPALISGTAQFGPMSREMKAKEIDEFEEKYGFAPTQIRTSLDALAIFVHKDNPLKSVSIEEADAIFSKTRKWGFAKDIITWGDLGLSANWQNQPIRVFGRNSASGTYGFFKDEVLKKGDYKDTVKEQPGSASVVQSVSEDQYAIGYSGIGYSTSGVRALPLSKKKSDKVYDGNYDNVVSKKYPLARYLYLYIVVDPQKPLDPLVKEFIKYVLSSEGQQIVVKDGYLPLPYDVVMEELKKLK